MLSWTRTFCNPPGLVPTFANRTSPWVSSTDQRPGVVWVTLQYVGRNPDEKSSLNVAANTVAAAPPENTIPVTANVIANLVFIFWLLNQQCAKQKRQTDISYKN